MHPPSEKDIVISIKDLEDISSEEEEDLVSKEEFENEYDQTVNRIKSNFYLRKESFNETSCPYSFSKEHFDLLLDQDSFYC